MELEHKSQMFKAVVYGAFNIFSVVAIVFANKILLGSLSFPFPVFLTWIHALVTAIGMHVMAGIGVFEVKQVAISHTLGIACSYASFVAFSIISIQVNSVGFYQLSKIAITPVVFSVEILFYGRHFGRQKIAAVFLLILGITVATVTDGQVRSNPLGMLVAGITIASSVSYAVWAGAKQKELGLSGNQLLHQVSPLAVLALGLMVPAVEPLGISSMSSKTIVGYSYSLPVLFWIGLTSILGLAVTASTYLFIGATSPSTYSVMSHLKTICILGGGFAFFGDELTGKKFIGLSCTLAGIIWYTSTSDSGKSQTEQAGKGSLPIHNGESKANKLAADTAATKQQSLGYRGTSKGSADQDEGQQQLLPK